MLMAERSAELGPMGFNEGRQDRSTPMMMEEASGQPPPSGLLATESGHSMRTLLPDSMARGETSFGGLLGGKTIGWFGSWVLTVNNITGPGMMHIAAVFQESGLVAPLVVFVLVCFTSTAAATLLCDALARLPGNQNLEMRYEYSDLFKYFFGERAFMASQILFFGAIFSQTAASIVGTAQSMDGLLVLLFGRSWAWEPSHEGGRFLEWEPKHYCGVKWNSSVCVPFSRHGHTPGQHGPEEIGTILTAGYIATCALLAPLGRLNLDDNIKFQIFSFFVLIVLSLEFVIAMGCQRGFDPTLIPLFGTNYTNMLGTIMFNFAFCPTIPAWLNEKKPEVRTSKVLWQAALSSTLLYLMVGILSAMSFRGAETNLLQTLSAGNNWIITKVSAFLFGVLVLGLGIPVFCIVMRYNLVVGGVCNNGCATMLAVVVPWMVSWVLYQGKASEIFINVSGTLLISLIGFVAPLFAALAATGVELNLRSIRTWPGKLFSQVALAPTVCCAVPGRWIHQQRRYVSGLLVVLLPMVLAGMYLQVVSF